MVSLMLSFYYHFYFFRVFIKKDSIVLPHKLASSLGQEIDSEFVAKRPNDRDRSTQFPPEGIKPTIDTWAVGGWIVSWYSL